MHFGKCPKQLSWKGIDPYRNKPQYVSAAGKGRPAEQHPSNAIYEGEMTAPAYLKDTEKFRECGAALQSHQKKTCSSKGS